MTRKSTKKAAPAVETSPEGGHEKAQKGRVLKRKPKAETPKASAPKKPARAKERAQAKAAQAETTTPPGSLAALRESFCAALVKKGKSAGTARSYAADLKVAERHFGADRPVTKLTRAEVEDYMTSALVTLGRSGAPKNPITIDKVLRVFRQALEHAVELGWIEASPMPAYERRSAKKATATATATAQEASDAEG